MSYLLDSSVCIRLWQRDNELVLQRFLSHGPESIRLCSVVKAELLYGARRSGQVSTNLQLLMRFFQPLTSLPFDDRCAEEYGRIRADLSRQGQLIGPNDMMIAATAQANDAVLVTHNSRKFSRVAGLRLEDWDAT